MTTKLSDAEVERRARAIYDECETPKPEWDSLGEATKSVWRSYIVTGSRYRVFVEPKGKKK